MAVLSFQIDYHTAWGQEVCLCGSIPELGDMDESKALPLTNEGDLWFTEVAIPKSREISYYYLIRERDNTVRREWGTPRSLRVIASKDYIVRDLWKNGPYHAYLYSSAFTGTFFAHPKEGLPERYHAQSVLLNVVCPYVRSEQTLVMSGDCEELGQWDLQRAKPMRCVDDGVWQLLLNAKKLPKRSCYKFVIVDKTTREAVHWEDGGNRLLEPIVANETSWVFAEMGLVFHHHRFQFKGVGTAIPLFSLRTRRSFGIGDFADLRKMTGWRRPGSS
jgi:4-alpha-glucanotransferase